MDLPLKDLETITTIGASAVVIFGGLGGLFQLVKTLSLLNKTIVDVNSRLEPSVSGTVFTRAGTTYVIAISRIKNVGATTYTLDPESTALSISSYDSVANIEPSTTSASECIEYIRIFTRHDYLAPGESIEEARIAAIPKDDAIALVLELQIASKDQFSTGHVQVWTAQSIFAIEKDSTS